MMVSPLSAGLAGSNSMAAYPNVMFRRDFAKRSFVFRICFPWLTNSTTHAAGMDTVVALPLGSDWEHRYFRLNESSNSLHLKGCLPISKPNCNKARFKRHDPDTGRKQS
jgi:hypothetical protein